MRQKILVYKVFGGQIKMANLNSVRSIYFDEENVLVIDYGDHCIRIGCGKDTLLSKQNYLIHAISEYLSSDIKTYFAINVSRKEIEEWKKSISVNSF